MFKKLFIITLLLLLLNCFNDTTLSLSVKSCNLPFQTIQEQLSVIKEKNATLYLQIREDDIENEKLTALLNEVKKQEIKFIAWPLLQKEEGPWANEYNYDSFGKLVFKVTDYLEKTQIKPEYIVINMENRASQMDTITNHLKNKEYKEIIELLMTNLNKENFKKAVTEYKKIVDKLHNKGYRVNITTYPFMVDDFKDGDPDIQDLANVPISGIDWDAYTFTPYRTAYSGDFGMAFTPYIVYNYASAAKKLFKEKARIALGIVGESSHGHGYMSPEDLHKDIAAVKATGIQQVDLFHFKGMVESEDAGAWINADVVPEIPTIDLKVNAARVFVQTLDKVLNDKYDEDKINKILGIADSLRAK